MFNCTIWIQATTPEMKPWAHSKMDDNVVNLTISFLEKQECVVITEVESLRLDSQLDHP